MKFNRIIVLSSLLLLLLFLSIAATTANENNTMESEKLDMGENLADTADLVSSNDSKEVYNAKIIVKNTTQKYNGDNEVVIKVVDTDNKIIDNAKVRINNHITPTTNDEGKYYFYFDLNPGTHKLKVTLDDSHYKAKPIFINLKIIKSKFTGKINCKSYWGVAKSTLTLKATVYNDDWDYYENGYVTFKVNGKSYKVKTKNGVATKKIKIKKAGNYKYTAKFTSNKYSSSVTGKGKLYVYSTSKKSRTVSMKGYKVVIPIAKYKKLVYAKHNGKTYVYKLNTGKKIKQKLDIYDKKTFEKTTKTVKSKIYIYIAFDGSNKYSGSLPAKQYVAEITTSNQHRYGNIVCKKWLFGYKQSKEFSKLNSSKLRQSLRGL